MTEIRPNAVAPSPGYVWFLPTMRVVFAQHHFVAYVYIMQLFAPSVCICECKVNFFFAFVMHLMHISCVAFTEICAFTVHVTECIHSAFNVLHYFALSCI